MSGVDHDLIEEIRDSARDWDGRDPVRPFPDLKQL